MHAYRHRAYRDPALRRPLPGVRVDSSVCTTHRIHMTGTVEETPQTNVWQARINYAFATELYADAEVLGLTNRTEIVKAALELLHQHAAELRMARGVERFYGAGPIPLPDGVVPLDESELDEDQHDA
jgi:hypothetical protein